jgi:hypothetical protein
MRPHLTVEQRWLALRLKARAIVARDLSRVSAGSRTVTPIAPHTSSQPVRQNSWVPGPGRITLADEEESILALHAGEWPHSGPRRHTKPLRGFHLGGRQAPNLRPRRSRHYR